MGTKPRVFGWTALFLMGFSGVGLLFGQRSPASSPVIPLTVQPGVPLHIELLKEVDVKNAGVPVEGRVVEPVYVFDHLVIPAGSRVEGKISKVEPIPRKQRALDIANGDFTPYRTAQVDFDMLVLPDGTRIPLQTKVSQGAPNLVHLSAGAQPSKKRGKVGQAVDEAKGQAKAREQAAIAEVTAPGKLERIKAQLSARLPYHHQKLAVGTSFVAELHTPLKFGNETPSVTELGQLGSEIPPGSIVKIRLVTPLSSATAQRGSVVHAVVSAPVYSKNHQLILPEGAQLEGSVTEAVPAKRLGRNGQLRFMFRRIELPGGMQRTVEATLQGVDTASGTNLQLDEEGGAHAVTPKTHYIMPAIDVFLAATSLDLDAGHHIHSGVIRQHGPDLGGGAARGAAGLGLIGSVIGIAAHSRAVSAGFAFYGAGISVYTHIMARGTDVTFNKNTPMEIRFGTHESPPSPASKGNPLVAGI
jgi:hypothetical protein